MVHGNVNLRQYDGLQLDLKALVNKGKICVFLPAEGKLNATFPPNFTQPGKSLLVQPCTALQRFLI